MFSQKDSYTLQVDGNSRHPQSTISPSQLPALSSSSLSSTPPQNTAMTINSVPFSNSKLTPMNTYNQNELTSPFPSLAQPVPSSKINAFAPAPIPANSSWVYDSVSRRASYPIDPSKSPLSMQKLNLDTGVNTVSSTLPGGKLYDTLATSINPSGTSSSPRTVPKYHGFDFFTSSSESSGITPQSATPTLITRGLSNDFTASSHGPIGSNKSTSPSSQLLFNSIWSKTHEPEGSTVVSQSSNMSIEKSSDNAPKILPSFSNHKQGDSELHHKRAVTNLEKPSVPYDFGFDSLSLEDSVKVDSDDGTRYTPRRYTYPTSTDRPLFTNHSQQEYQQLPSSQFGNYMPFHGPSQSYNTAHLNNNIADGSYAMPIPNFSIDGALGGLQGGYNPQQQLANQHQQQQQLQHQLQSRRLQSQQLELQHQQQQLVEQSKYLAARERSGGNFLPFGNQWGGSNMMPYHGGGGGSSNMTMPINYSQPLCDMSYNVDMGSINSGFAMGPGVNTGAGVLGSSGLNEMALSMSPVHVDDPEIDAYFEGEFGLDIRSEQTLADDNGYFSKDEKESSSVMDNSTVEVGVDDDTDKSAHHGLSSSPALYNKYYMVKFKKGRTDVFYLSAGSSLNTHMGDLVIVDADRGRDLGKVYKEITRDMAHEVKLTLQRQQMAVVQPNDEVNNNNNSGDNNSQSNVTPGLPANCPITTAMIMPKQILRFAQRAEISQLKLKMYEEIKSEQLCRLKVEEKNLDMKIINAEFQWDKRKLTFFYKATKRVDFRDLVRDLFRVYKTRIWMCAVNSNKETVNC